MSNKLFLNQQEINFSISLVSSAHNSWFFGSQYFVKLKERNFSTRSELDECCNFPSVEPQRTLLPNSTYLK